MSTPSKIEDEVWESEIACWARLKAFDIEGLLSIYHANHVGWPNSQPALMAKDGLRALMSAMFATLVPGD